MKKVAVIGSFIVDLMARTPHLPEPGETVMGSFFKAGPGGKGGNQAVAAKRAGSNLVYSTKIGKDSFAEIARASFAENGISMILGASATYEEEDLEKLKEALSGCEYLLLQMEINREATERLISMAYDMGIRVILNPAPVQQLSEELYSKLYLVTPNEVEARILTEIACDDIEGCRQAARVFMEKGVERVIITIGKRGVYYYDGETEEIIGNYNVKVLDTTGAGDAFNGGLLAGLSQGMELLSAARYGNVVSNLAVTKLGTAPAMPTKQEIDVFIEKEQIKF